MEANSSKPESVGQVVRDPGRREGADRAAVERRGEGGDVLVLHRATVVADRALGVPVGDAERHRPLRDERGERGAADLDDRTADELRQVEQVAADVGERAGAGSAAVAPGDRRGRVQRVVAPVVPVEMHQLAERAGGEFAPDLLDGRRSAIGVADGGHPVGSLGRGDHRLGVGQRARQRLLAQHVLACGQQSLDDLAVQMVGHHDAHRVDIRRIGDRAPVVFGALVAVALGGVVGDGGVGVGDRDQPHVRPIGAEQRGRGAVSGGMGAAGHPTADHGHADGVGVVISRTSFGVSLLKPIY